MMTKAKEGGRFFGCGKCLLRIISSSDGRSAEGHSRCSAVAVGLEDDWNEYYCSTS
jgi:hypothetical protein